MRPIVLAALVGAFAAGAILGCAVSPEQREATERAWAERDADRARECGQKGGRWLAGGCVRGGGP
jgi:hypothetical protein